MTVILTQAVPEGRVFGLDQQTLIGIGIQLINGIILAVALGVILYKPVVNFMEKRSKSIQNKIDDAASTMEKAKNLISEYEMKISDIEKERIRLLEESYDKIELERQKILEEAREEANELKRKALANVAEEKKNLQEESRIHMIELSSLIAQKYITENLDNGTLNRIFDETLTKLEGTTWQS